jgi:predicted ATPase
LIILQIGEWSLAYLYSKFAIETFHENHPKRLLFVDEALYTWKFAEAHAAACFYCGEKKKPKNHFYKYLK